MSSRIVLPISYVGLKMLGIYLIYLGLSMVISGFTLPAPLLALWLFIAGILILVGV